MSERKGTKGATDFFRAYVQRGTTAARRAAVNKLGGGDSDVAILARLAATDEDLAIRKLAIERLEPPELLAEVAKRQSDPALRQLASEKAATQWGHVASSGGEQAQAALAGLLAFGCDVSLLAVTLRAVALEADREIGCKAVDHLDDRDALASVAARAQDPEVRQRAQARLADLKPTVKGANAVGDGHREHGDAIDLVQQAEDLADRLDQAVAAERLAALTQQWPPVNRVDQALLDRWDAATQRIIDPALGTARQADGPAVRRRMGSNDSIATPALAPREADQARPGMRLASQLRAMVKDLEALTDEDDLIEVSRALDEANRAFAMTGEFEEGDRHARQQHYREQSDQRAESIRAARKAPDWERKQNVPKQEALINEAHELARQPLTEGEARELSTQLRGLQARWKLVASVPAAYGSDLWNEFQAACEAVFHRISDERAKASDLMAAQVATREELIKKAEALSTSTDWVVTTEAIRQLQAEWKATGHVPRQFTEGQWDRFSAACGRFFEARKPVVEAEREVQGRAASEREALVLQIEELVAKAPLNGSWSETTGKFKQLQQQWKNVGFVPGRTAAALRQRVNTAGDALYERRNAARDAVAQAMRDELAKLATKVAEALAASEGVGALTLAIREQVAALATREIVPDANLLSQLEQLALHALQTDRAGLRGSSLDPAITNKQRVALISSVRAMLPKPSPKLQGDESTARIAEILTQSVAKFKVGLQQDFRTPNEAADDFVAQWRALGPIIDSAGRTAQLAFDDAIAALRQVEDPRSAALDAGERTRS
ncbi:MAG: DUF349 domain-containing protein [Myxococcales bacterium]|nr:DUF349 domain-containing protein [Myxococcales bacterium]